MRRSTVLKALSMMDESRVKEFLDNDCRSIDEIVDAVTDELEKKYIYFMVDLFEIVGKLEIDEETQAKKLMSGNIVNLSKELILNKISEEDYLRFKEKMKDFSPSLNISIPKIDYSNLHFKRGD